MRDIMVTDLVANLLGPHKYDEEMEDNPLFEYVTGILAPIKGKKEQDGGEPGIGDAEMGGGGDSTYEGDEIGAEGEAAAAPAAPAALPALDPKRTPSTMGMTFYALADGMSGIDLCVTWAKYEKRDKKWKRMPRHAVLSSGCKEAEDYRLGADGGEAASRAGEEVSVHVRPRAEGGHVSVSIHLVNRMGPGADASESVGYHVFQPQIRVLCRGGTRLVPQPGARNGPDEEETEQEMLYSDKRALGKGHLTSVVWRDIDPECLRGGPGPDNPECLEQPGFAWADGAGLPDADRERFSSADIRTEYVPMYAVPAPDADHWPGGPGCRPRLDARFYSDMYDPDALADALAPLAEASKEWADRVEEAAEKEAGGGGIALRAVERAREAQRRIQGGIDLLRADDDARLSFCFACRAMDIQAQWAKGESGFEFRPFQLAFVLLSAESALNPKSPDRRVCDLLWVPTGAGKTEAYLTLAAMVAAHRRLKAKRKYTKDRSGVGVSVISRYTLRLLTIQQFRRTLSLITAMEYLRVDGIGAGGGGKRVGWRPAGCGNEEDFLWGTARFSVGLWAGSGVTPNRLKDGFSTSTKRVIPGALSLLREPDRQRAARDDSHGEPALVLDCPACGSVLSLPAGGLRQGPADLHYAVRVADGDAAAAESVPDEDAVDANGHGVEGVRVTLRRIRGRVFALTIRMKIKTHLDHRALRDVCERVRLHLVRQRVSIEYLSARTRPGYFFKRRGDGAEYDFEVFCPNGDCPLRREWAAGTARGNANGDMDDGYLTASSVRGADSPDGNLFVDVNEAFRVERHISDRIPVPAFTVDDQVYANIPTMIVATVDKFARMPFESRSAQLFGNVDHCHHIRGYYRLAGGKGKHPTPTGTKSSRHYERLERQIEPPNLIIQDELHLLDGPLGSMVGIYEAAVDRLASGKAPPVKYVASTATTRRADSHVGALFSRGLAVFPPQGTRAGDRLFIGGPDGATPLDESGPGRLYVGVWAPGRGPLTPLVRIWSRLACSINSNEDDPNVGKYWTITGYFSSVRELADARSLYRQNIPEWADHLSCGGGPRMFGEEEAIELSALTPSADLPAYLHRLEGDRGTGAPRALFATSMFGTGVDVPGISTMVVVGQPKTQSSYIQATGRVGRTRGAVVVTLYKPGRPRDLNHYELFARYHMQLHRFVEPPTVFPFAAGVMERAAGPVMASILRNERGLERWALNDGGALAAGEGEGKADMEAVASMLSERASKQPERKRPDPDDVSGAAGAGAARWRTAAGRHEGLAYDELNWRDEPKKHVVLGDPAHARAGKSPVFEDVPNSMRGVEEEAVFEA